MTLDKLRELYAGAQQEQQPEYEAYEAACHAIYKAFPDLIAAVEALVTVQQTRTHHFIDNDVAGMEGWDDTAQAILKRLGVE